MDISSVDLAKEIGKLIDEYGVEVNGIVQEEVSKIAKDARKKVGDEARKKIDGKKYVKNFKDQGKKTAGGTFVEHILYNKDYRLTHLLEKGHVIANSKNGKKTRAFPHFSVVNDWISSELPKRIENRINKIK